MHMWLVRLAAVKELGQSAVYTERPSHKGTSHKKVIIQLTTLYTV